LRERFVGVPIIANGGIETREDIARCLAETGAAGVMSSEGVLEDPQIFVDSSSNGSSQNGRKTQFDIAEEYLALCRQFPPRGFKAMRSHIMKILFRYFEIHEDLRQAAGDARTIDALDEIIHRLRELASQLGEAAYPVSWYNRHNSQYQKHDMSKKVVQPALWTIPDENDCGGNFGDDSLFDGLRLFTLVDEDDYDNINNDQSNNFEETKLKPSSRHETISPAVEDGERSMNPFKWDGGRLSLL